MEATERAANWLCWAAQYNSDREQYAAQYRTFVAQEHSAVAEHDVEQIEKDLPRTCWDGDMVLLRHILLAVAEKQQGGYTQSMNSVVAVAISQLSAGSAASAGDIFWFCLTIFRDLLPGYHDDTLLGTRVASKVLNEIFEDEFPEESKALCAEGFSVEFLAVEWLLSICSTVLQPVSVQLVWDELLQQGECALLRILIVALHWCFDKCCSDGALGDAVNPMQSIKTGFMSCTPADMQQIINQASAMACEVTDGHIDTLKSKHRVRIMQERIESQLRSQVADLRKCSFLTITQAKALRTQLQQSSGGHISPDEFAVLLSKMFCQEEGALHPDASHLFFGAFDADNNGTLEVAEVLQGVALMTSKSLSAFVENMFTVFDADHNGQLDHNEVRAMLTWLYFVQYSQPPTELQVQRNVECMFSTMDSDQSGTLDLAKLLTGYVGLPLIADCFSTFCSTNRVRLPNEEGEWEPVTQGPPKVNLHRESDECECTFCVVC